jgi:ABC-type uncharacterized transport system substrate-binding protein
MMMTEGKTNQFHRAHPHRRFGFRGLLLLLSGIVILCGISGCRKGPASAEAQSLQQSSETQSAKKVLVLHSYNFEYEWVRAVNRGINLILASLPEVEIQHFYMDTKRQTSTAWKQQVAGEVLAFIDTWQPDVVLAADDNAQEWVGRKIAERGAPAWVFCGVNSNAQKYGFPTDNVTGVLERPHLIESLQFFKQIKPDAKRVVFLTDSSLTSEATLEYCIDFYENNPFEIKIIDWISALTLDEWKQAVLKYTGQVDAFAIYTYHTLQDGSSLSVTPRDVMDWTTQNSTVPIVGFLTFAIEDGAFCGVFESGIEQGQIAGQMVLDILNGKSPKDIPVVTATQGQTAINMDIANKYQIEISDSILTDTHLIIGNGKKENNGLSD